MICCTFAGHRDAYESAAEDKVRALLFSLLEQDDDFCFFSGSIGRFDLMCERIVREIKRLYPQKRIQLMLVLPYMHTSINTHSRYFHERYDDIIFPSELEGCPHKAAILRRNRWMIDRSDYLIAYVFHCFGGAYATLKYARRRSITIWNVAEPPAVGLNAYPKIWE